MLLLIPAPMVHLCAMVASLPLPLPSLVSEDARVPTIITATTLRVSQAIRRDTKTEPDMSFAPTHVGGQFLVADHHIQGRSHAVVRT